MMKDNRKRYVSPQIEVNDFISRNRLMIEAFPETSTIEILGKENVWDESDEDLPTLEVDMWG